MKIPLLVTTISLTLATSFFYSPTASAITWGEIAGILGLGNSEQLQDPGSSDSDCENRNYDHRYHDDESDCGNHHHHHHHHDCWNRDHRRDCWNRDHD